MEKMNGKLVTFTGIIVLVLLVAIFGFLFWEPKPEYIQGEAEATEVTGEPGGYGGYPG